MPRCALPRSGLSGAVGPVLRYVQRLCEEVEQRQASAHDDGATLHDIIKSFDAFEVNLATSLLRTFGLPA